MYLTLKYCNILYNELSQMIKDKKRDSKTCEIFWKKTIFYMRNYQMNSAFIRPDSVTCMLAENQNISSKNSL